MSFSQPTPGGDQFQPSEHIGHLLLIYPKAYDPAAMTKASDKPTSQTDVDVIVVDKLGPDGAPLVFRDARVFGALARAVRVLTEPDGSPKKYLGRLGQGEKKVGQSPPWILINWTDQDLAQAQPVAAAFEAGQFGQPVAPNPMQQQAPQQQWQQQPPPSAGQYQTAPPPQQQWQTPAPPAAPAYAQQAQPTAPVQQQQFQPPQQSGPPPGQQQFQAPATHQAQWNATAAPAAPQQPQAPAPAPTGAEGIDPAVAQFLQARGIPIQPGMGHADAVAVGKSFQPDFSQQFPQY